jgi:hypothetical protein
MSVVLYCPERAWRNAFFMYLDRNENYIPLVFTVVVLAYVCLTLMCELRNRAAAAPPSSTIELMKAERKHVAHAITTLEQHMAMLDAKLGELSPLEKRPAKRARIVVPESSRR